MVARAYTVAGKPCVVGVRVVVVVVKAAWQEPALWYAACVKW